MKIGIFSDPHIGLRRSEHTSVRSRKLLREHLFGHAYNIARNLRATHDMVILPGDLFDRYTNDEEIILQGGELADQCDFVLAGNHDLKNNVNTLSSLQLLHQRNTSGTRYVINKKPDSPYFLRHTFDHTPECFLYFIPHAFTQELFVESIMLACSDANSTKRKKYLFLHCNVGEAHGKVEDEGCTLALTDDLQKLVSETFTRVLIGHEHTPSVKRGNIHILGNTFPVHFGEIGDRYSYTLDTDTGELTRTKIFDSKVDYRQFELDEFLEQSGKIDCAEGLIQINGHMRAETYPELSRALMAFWKQNEDTLFAVKNSVEIIRAPDVKKAIKTGRVTLREIINREVGAAGFSEELAEISLNVTED